MATQLILMILVFLVSATVHFGFSGVETFNIQHFGEIKCLEFGSMAEVYKRIVRVDYSSFPLSLSLVFFSTCRETFK